MRDGGALGSGVGAALLLGAIMGCVVCWGAHHVYFLANQVFYLAYRWPTIRAKCASSGRCQLFTHSQNANHHPHTRQKIPGRT